MDQKIKKYLALLAIVAVAVLGEQAILKSQRLVEQNFNYLVGETLLGSISTKAADTDINQVALAGTDIALFLGAKRLTFDGGNSIRYRLNASAKEVADFYKRYLALNGWVRLNTNDLPAENSDKIEKVSITLSENPLSKKTDVTYAFVSPNQPKVMGIELAQSSEPLSSPSGNQPQSSTGDMTAPGNNAPEQQPYQGLQPLERQDPTQPRQPMPMQNQTCRINGVEMPGSCANYNNSPSNSSAEWGRPSSDGQTAGPDQMNNQSNQGPSEEDMKKMDEQRFQDMKKGLKQFTKSIKSMKKSVVKVKTAIAKCGVNIPEELDSAMANSDSYVSKIEAAKTADELDEAVSDIEDIGSVMQEWGPRLGDLQRLCQMIKQADRDIKTLDRSQKQAESRVKANKKMDLSELLTEYKSNVTEMKTILADVKALAKTDQEEALIKLEDDFYGQMDNVRNSEQTIMAVLNITKGLTDVTREIKNYDNQLKALAKKKIDITDATELLNGLKNQIAEIKKLIKSKFDADELVDKVETAFDSRAELQDLLQDLGSGPQLMPKISGSSNYNLNVNLPDAFKKQAAEEQPVNSQE